MSENKERKQPNHRHQHHHHHHHHHHLSTPPPDDHPDQESSADNPQHHQQPQVVDVPTVVDTFISVPSAGDPASSSFDQPHKLLYEAVNPKRPRYSAASVATQWKPVSSPSPQKQSCQSNVLLIAEATSSPTTQAPANIHQIQPHSMPASSSDTTASSPSHSPRPSRSAPSSGQDATKPEGHQQFRKGKYVSPVWKPNEMLWLARAWRVQYHGGTSSSEGAGSDIVATAGRGKSRGDKDREVAEFLNRHGVNRDVKTAGTKWDNMLGEFRKVYEWERGGEREQVVGKSYFRLSPFERKLRRLPASFDEEVFEELSQFMGSRMKTSSHIRGGYSSSAAALSGGDDGRKPLAVTTTSLPPPLLRDEDLSCSARAKQLGLTTGSESFYHGARGDAILGFDSSIDVAAAASAISSKELRRIGKMRMIWEESVSLWAEEGEHHRGRLKLQCSNFLNADEITFLDDSMVASTMEAFEEGSLKGFSVDRFLPGQQVKVFGRRKSFFPPVPPGFGERVQQPSNEFSIRSISPWEYQDPTEYYLGCLRIPSPTLPSLFELSWHLQEPPPEELRFPLRKDVYKDLPQGKELFFTTSVELLDCRAIVYEILSATMRSSNPGLTGPTATCRESFIGLWDDCINRIVSKFCSVEMVFVRKGSSSSALLAETMQDQWPNVTAFLKNFCLWRGEETDQLREGHVDPSSSIVEKLLWTFNDLPYILGYYAVGYCVTFCAISRSQDRIIRTDLCTLDLSSPVERLKALIPCWRIAGLLPLLAERCCIATSTNNGNNLRPFPYSDFERVDLGGDNLLEMTPNTMIRFFSAKKRWAAVKEIYDFLDRRIPHSEFLVQSSEKDLALVFKPRCCKFKPTNCDQLIEALKHVTKALVALHDLSFMHRDLCWEKVVVKRSERENEQWFVTGFDEAVSAPQIYPHGGAASGRHAPEMCRGLHGVKVDVWGVGQLVKTCGLVVLPKLLRDLQNRCLDHNPEQRPTAADCYHHLLQLQSSVSAAASGVY